MRSLETIGWNLEVGTIHQVNEVRIPDPGECSETPTNEDCEVADFETGARLDLVVEADAPDGY